MKDSTFREYTIKIDLVRSSTKIEGGVEYADKMFLVDIQNGSLHTMFGVPATKNHRASRRKVFKRIMEELYLA